MDKKAVYVGFNLRNFGGIEFPVPPYMLLELKQGFPYNEAMAMLFEEIKNKQINVLFLDINGLAESEYSVEQNIKIAKKCLRRLTSLYLTQNSFNGEDTGSKREALSEFTILFLGKDGYEHKLEFRYFDSSKC